MRGQAEEQAPLAEQLSARVASQAAQTAPPRPQVDVPGMLHVAPEQQPLAQLVALQLLQTPAVQVALTGQVSQASPAVPHCRRRRCSGRSPPSPPPSTWAPSSPIRMTEPLPNSRSICVSAP